MMEIQASAKYLRISPRKLRLLTRGLRGLSPAQALTGLERYPQKGSEYLEKAIKQARANAINNFKLTEENLKISKIEVGEGPAYKRMDKSHGARFDRGIIKKRTAHLYLTLQAAQKAQVQEAGPVKEEKPEVKKKERRPASTKVTAGQSGKKG